MTVGLFMDGYFHENLEGESESFLTPWHAVFYAGFAASALWFARMSRGRSPDATDWTLRHLPPGYDGARIGIMLFALGGAGDAAWHTAYGVERGVDALLSPTHLVLSVGLVLILTAPLRAARVATASLPGPWMVVGSVTSAAALVGFFLNFAWGLGIAAFARVPYDPITEAGETQVIAGIASMLVTTTILFGAARFVLFAGRTRAGAFTVLFGAVASLVSAAFDEDIEGVVAAVVAGIALDLFLRTFRGDDRHASGLAAPFGLASAVLWLVYLGLLRALDGIAWQAEIWMGGIVLNALAAVLVAAMPPKS